MDALILGVWLGGAFVTLCALHATELSREADQHFMFALMWWFFAPLLLLYVGSVVVNAAAARLGGALRFCWDHRRLIRAAATNTLTEHGLAP